jgi:hypothetical protein
MAGGPRDSEPIRRLRSGSASERPIGSQPVLAFMLVLMLVAVPLYLLRRPEFHPTVEPAAGTEVRAFGGVIRTEYDAGPSAPEVSLGPLQRVRCGASAADTTGEGSLCDALPLLEAALRQGISGSVDCAPRGGKDGSINYVLEVDFTSNRVNVFAGKSGKWRGARARKAVTCVLRSLPPLAWADIEHQHQYYAIAILASYPGSAEDDDDAMPTFE